MLKTLSATIITLLAIANLSLLVYCMSIGTKEAAYWVFVLFPISLGALWWNNRLYKKEDI